MKNYENIIKENAQKYYEDGTQKLSDRAFDALIDEVKKENPNSEVLKTGWGYEVNENGKVKHKYGHIGSLDKVHNWKELQNKLCNFSIFDISAKLDGLSAVLYFKNGILDLALTRGDGEYGIDITNKIGYILNKNFTKNNYIKIDDDSFTGAIRGEIMMLPKDFEKYKSNHPEAKNHRNSAAGLINGDEITEDYKYLNFVAYSIVGDEQNTYKYRVPALENEFSHYAYIDNINIWLSENFEHTAPRKTIELDVNSYENQLQDLKNEWSKEYYLDGVVITEKELFINLNNFEVVYYHVAYKFDDETKVTKVIDIEWNMSKNSEMIPVLQVKPVELEGTTVKRVTAFNAKFVQDNNLGSGATILICKRNQIIPYVMEVIESAKFPDLPVTCGYCGQMLLWDENHVHLRCFNNNCVQKENEDLKAICLNLAPVDGLGWKTINKILKKSWSKINNLEDLLKIDESSIQHSAGELALFIEMLYKLQNDKFIVSQFLLALNIPGLGKISAKRWEEDKNALDYLEYVANTNMNYNDKWVALEQIIQDKNVVISLRIKYHDKFNMYYNLLRNRIKHIQTDTLQCGDVCITGSLSMKRADFEKLLIQKGWTLVNTIKTSTKYLITNTPESGTSKNKKADELGVEKITEKEFFEKYL